MLTIENGAYDLRAVNPNAKNDKEKLPPAQMLDMIENKRKEIAEAIAVEETIGKY